MSFDSVNACLSVEQRVVDHLRDAPPAVLVHSARSAEDFLRRLVVDVLAAVERLDERFVAGHVRENAQLDLRIVGGDQRVPRVGYERAANLAAQVQCGSGCSAGWDRCCSSDR